MTKIARSGGATSIGMDPVPTQIVPVLVNANVLPDNSITVTTTVKTAGGRVLTSIHADDVDVSPSDGSIVTASINSSTGTITINGIALGLATVTPKLGALSGTPITVSCVVSFAGPNQPTDDIIIWQADPSHPDGLDQPGTIHSGLTSIVDAPWSPNGKAFRLILPGSSRATVTNIQPVVGGLHDGWTQITAPGFGAAYLVDYYTYGGGLGGTYPGTLTVYGIPGVLGNNMNGAQLWSPSMSPSRSDPYVVDDDNVYVPWDMTLYGTFTPGSDMIVGFAGGIGASYLNPESGIFCSLYNSRMYLSMMVRVHEDYANNLGAGAKFVFGMCQSIFQSSIYGASWGGIGGPNDRAREKTGPLGIGADWSADGEPGGGSNHGIIGAGYTDGHFSYDWENPDRPDWLVRGEPMTFELLMVGNAEGDNDAEVRMWYNKTIAGPSDYQRTAFQFCDGTYGFVGYGPRGFTLLTVDNTDGGGGMLPVDDKIVDFAYLTLSGGYAREGEAPDHWELTADNLTPTVGDTVHVTGTLVDANGNTVQTCVNPSPFGNGGAFGSGSDVQFDTDNGATWSVRPGSWSDNHGGVTLEQSIARMGQIGLDVVIVNPGTVHVQYRDIARALNNQRYGSWRVGSLDLEAAA